MNPKAKQSIINASFVKLGITRKGIATLKTSANCLTETDKKRVKVITNHWLDYAEMIERIESIAGEFPSVLDKIATFHGELPESSNYKTDTISAKVDQLKRIYITHNQRQAYEMIMLVPLPLREYVTLWPQVKGKHNPDSGRNFSRLDMLRYFGVCEKTYKTRTSMAKKVLIAIDKRENPALYRGHSRTNKTIA